MANPANPKWVISLVFEWINPTHPTCGNPRTGHMLATIPAPWSIWNDAFQEFNKSDQTCCCDYSDQTCCCDYENLSWGRPMFYTVEFDGCEKAARRCLVRQSHWECDTMIKPASGEQRIKHMARTGCQSLIHTSNLMEMPHDLIISPHILLETQDGQSLQPAHNWFTGGLALLFS